MDEGPAAATAALDFMREWEWRRYDPDGSPFGLSMELSLVVNRLAMEGIPRPQDVLLNLLCQGNLLAEGDYQWRKYQGGNHYQLDGTGAILKPRHWQTLADLIEDERQECKAGGFLLDLVELTKLGMEGRYPYDWDFAYSRFNTSLCPPDTPVHNRIYYEEWFSAWNVEVRPRMIEAPFSDPEPKPIVQEVSKGGAPRKWDWDGAFLHLAALAHHGVNGLFRDDGGDPNQSDIARHLQAWFIDTCGNAPENSQLRDYGKRFVTELNALKLRDANNSTPIR